MSPNYRILMPYIIAKRLRIYPYSEDTKVQVCLKLEVYGCAFKGEIEREGKGRERETHSDSHCLVSVSCTSRSRYPSGEFRKRADKRTIATATSSREAGNEGGRGGM